MRAPRLFATACAVLALSCTGEKPNPLAGYVLQISVDTRFDVSLVTGMQVVLDSLPFGPSLRLAAGPGETISVGGASVVSRRTDIDADGEVEAVFSVAANPFGATRRFDLPLRSPGYTTVPFYLRVDLLGAAGVLGSATVGRTADGRALNFDLGDTLDVPVTVACVEGRSCTGTTASDGGTADAGLADAGASDAGVADAGIPPGDGGLTLPASTLAFSRDTNDDGVEDTLALYDARAATTTTLVGGAGTEIDAFRWSASGATLFVVSESGGVAELVATAPGGTPRVLAQAPSLTDLTLAAPGHRVAARTLVDGGARWLVRPADGADAGIDVDSVAGVALAFSPTGSDVVLPVPDVDGGVSAAMTTVDALEVRILLALARLTALAFSPLGTHVALVGARAGETNNNLYLVSVLGDPIVRVIAESTTGGVQDVAFSTDGLRVGFRADLNAAGVFELYVASPGLRGLSGGVAPGGTGVSQWAFDPASSSRVAFLADRRTAGVRELYTATLSGVVPRRVSGDGLDGGVASFAFSRGGTRVAYRTDSGRIHVVSAAGAPIDLGDGDAFVFSPDEAWLAVVRAGSLFLVAADASQSVGPIATGLREKRLAWRPTP
jgi:hypothetical protein